MTGRSDLLALSVQHPMALALALGIKPVENRDWRYPPSPKVIGQRIALHASKAIPNDTADVVEELLADNLWPTTLLPPNATDGELHHGFEDDLGRILGDIQKTAGSILAVGTLARVVRHGDGDPLNDSPWRTDAPFGLVFTDVVRLDQPVSAKGMLGFWKVPPEAAARVLAQVERARELDRAAAGGGR